jgi:hypothetical protein
VPICMRHGVGFDAGGVCPQCQTGAPSAGVDGWFPWVCLTVGQVVSLAGVVVSAGVAVWGLGQLVLPVAEPAPLRAVPPTPLAADYSGWARLAGGAVGFFYSAGLWLVFGRSKRTGWE